MTTPNTKPVTRQAKALYLQMVRNNDERLDGLLLAAGEIDEASGDALTLAEDAGLVMHQGLWKPTALGREVLRVRVMLRDGAAKAGALR